MGPWLDAHKGSPPAPSLLPSLRAGTLVEASNMEGERLVIEIVNNLKDGWYNTVVIANDGVRVDPTGQVVHFCGYVPCQEQHDRVEGEHLSIFRRTNLGALSKSEMFKLAFTPASTHRSRSPERSEPPVSLGGLRTSRSVPPRSVPRTSRAPFAPPSRSSLRSQASARSSSPTRVSPPPRPSQDAKFERLLETLVRQGERSAKEVTIKDIQRIYRTRPYELVRQDLEGIMETVGSDEYDAEGEMILRPAWRVYVKSALHPDVRANRRSLRELQTLAAALDLLIADSELKKQQAMALLSRRFLAVEQAVLDGGWKYGAQQMELLPAMEESAATTAVQRAARNQAREELKYAVDTLKRRQQPPATPGAKKKAPSGQKPAAAAKKKSFDMKKAAPARPDSSDDE